MPPKKAKKDVAAKLADKENLARAETEVLSLQRLLELRSHEAVEARRSEKLWRERMEAFKEAYEKLKADSFDIHTDMTRQYKTMQEQLMRKYDEADQEIQALKEDRDGKEKEIKQLHADMKAMRRACDVEIMEYQRKMEDMQVEFTQMLRDTLDNMHERLAATF